MQEKNIYFNARKSAGLTQERWAEMLGISPEAVYQYESDKIIPSDDVVACMAEIAMMPPLGYWHLRHKSAIAREELPPVSRIPLPQAVCELISRIQDFTCSHQPEELLRIAANGKVDEDETERFREIVQDLHGIVQSAIQVNYSENGCSFE